MAGLIRGFGATGQTVYAQLRNAAGAVWNGSAFEAYVEANWATYDLATTEQAGSGYYSVAFPAAIVTAGKYDFVLYSQLGGSPASGDTPISVNSIQWDGSAEESGWATGVKKLSSGGVDDILDEVVEGSYTLRQLIRLFASSLGGKLSGAATTTVLIRDTGDTKDRVTATVDADGNRSAVTLDLT